MHFDDNKKIILTSIFLLEEVPTLDFLKESSNYLTYTMTKLLIQIEVQVILMSLQTLFSQRRYAIFVL